MKKIILLTLTILILLFSFSIEGNDENSKSNQKNKYVIYNMEQRPKNLIMTDNKNVREKDLIVSLFEGLVSLNDKGEIVPALCKEYNVSEDGIQYTFNLRENIRYSNGEKITANDFVQFFEEFLCDEKNIYREDLNCIFGVKQFINDTEDFSNVAIKAIDEKTLAIRLNNPCENFIYMLSKPVMSLRKYTALKNENTITKDTLFTGPFIIQDITHDNEIVISKNKNYYKNNLVTNEKIIISFINDKEKALAYFEEEESKLDIMIDPPINELSRLEEKNFLQGFDGDSSVYINFNLNKDLITTDLNFRKAINESMSKEFFIQQICKEFGNVASCYGVDQCGKFSSYGNNNLALRYLKNSKYNDEVITFLYKNNPIEKRIAEDLSKDIKDDLDINIKLKAYNNDEELTQNNKFHMILALDNNRDKDKYFLNLSSEKYKKFYGFANEKYDKSVQQLLGEKHNKDKIEIYDQCENLLREELPIIPIYNLNTVLCKKNNIENIYINKHGNIVLCNLKK